MALFRCPLLDAHRFHLTINDGQLGIGGFIAFVGFCSGLCLLLFAPKPMC